jgi:SAM-dependent methyltransferase
LAAQGYAVTLVDLSQGELEFARARAAELELELTGYVCANALDLATLPAAGFDAMLLMGPLYHLLEAKQRRRAVLEARRLLKPGAVLCATVITRYAPVRWSAALDPEWIVAGREQCDALLATGRMRGPNFTDAYYAHPTEVRPLFEDAGFTTLDIIGVEGSVARLEDRVNALDGEMWQAWVEMNYRIGKDPVMHGAADHLLYVGRKPHLSPPTPSPLSCSRV